MGRFASGGLRDLDRLMPAVLLGWCLSRVVQAAIGAKWLPAVSASNKMTAGRAARGIADWRAKSKGRAAPKSKRRFRRPK